MFRNVKKIIAPVGMLAFCALAVSFYAGATNVSAEQATGGASIHKQDVYWWTAKNSGTEEFVPYLLSAGKDYTSTSISKVGNSELAITCTISNLSPVGLVTKAPGNATVTDGSAADKGGWKGESHSLLYNSGDATNNLLANGLIFAGANSRIMKTRLMKTGLQAEKAIGAGKWSPNPGPWTSQVIKFGGKGALGNNGNLILNNKGNLTWNWPEETEFDLACSVSVAGSNVPLEGLVLANAESNGNYNTPEWQEFTPQGEGAENATWHALDIWSACEPSSDVYSISEDNVLRNHPVQGMHECFDDNKSASSSAILHGATSVHVKMHEDAKDTAAGAIAVGVYVSSDFGDAPESYGVAANYWSGPWTNALERGRDYVLRDLEGAKQHTDVYSTGTEKQAPNFILGAIRDTEYPSDIVLDDSATGDDIDREADEDAFESGKDIFSDLKIENGNLVYSYDASCTANGSTGYVGAWIDWNLDGSFNEGSEQSKTVCDGGGS